MKLKKNIILIYNSNNWAISLIFPIYAFHGLIFSFLRMRKGSHTIFFFLINNKYRKNKIQPCKGKKKNLYCLSKKSMTITITVVIGIATSIVTLGIGLMTLTKSIYENQAIFSRIKKTLLRKSVVVIDEFNEDGKKNSLYEAVEIYLGNILSSQKCTSKACKPEEKNSIKVTLEHNKKVKDDYDGHKFKWIWLQFKCFDHPEDNSVHKYEVKSFNLTFRNKDFDFVRDTYLPHIYESSNIRSTCELLPFCELHIFN